jgi:hypothetical protein
MQHGSREYEQYIYQFVFIFPHIISDACICRLRGDPILETYDHNVLLLVGSDKYTMTKHIDPNDPCSFNIEVKTGHFSNVRGQTFPIFVDVEFAGYLTRLDQDGRVFVSILQTRNSVKKC